MPKPINSRAKGKAGELEFAKLIEERIGVKMTRNLGQCRSGRHDLVVSGGPPELAAHLDRFAIEVKRAKTAPPATRATWWAQACKQAERAERLPLLAYRRDREGWLIMLPLAALSGKPHQLGTCEMNLDSFIVWTRNEEPGA